MTLLYLALGGALGTLARYGLGGWIHGWAGTGLPWGTLAVNLLGSLVLGLTLHVISHEHDPPFLTTLIHPPETDLD